MRDPDKVYSQDRRKCNSTDPVAPPHMKKHIPAIRVGERALNGASRTRDPHVRRDGDLGGDSSSHEDEDSRSELN